MGRFMNRRDAETRSFRENTEKVIGACIAIARWLTYLKLSGLTLGLLIHFNVPVLKDGIKRIANNFVDSSASPRLCGEPKEFRL